MSNPTYSISRNGKPVGAFDSNQVRQMYEAGVLQATDHAWTEGMKEWQTLASLFPALSPPPLPVSAPAVPKAQPAPVHGCLAAVAPVGRSGWALAAG